MNKHRKHTLLLQEKAEKQRFRQLIRQKSVLYSNRPQRKKGRRKKPVRRP